MLLEGLWIFSFGHKNTRTLIQQTLATLDGLTVIGAGELLDKVKDLFGQLNGHSDVEIAEVVGELMDTVASLLPAEDSSSYSWNNAGEKLELAYRIIKICRENCSEQLLAQFQERTRVLEPMRDSAVQTNKNIRFKLTELLRHIKAISSKSGSNADRIKGNEISENFQGRTNQQLYTQIQGLLETLKCRKNLSIQNKYRELGVTYAKYKDYDRAEEIFQAVDKALRSKGHSLRSADEHHFQVASANLEWQGQTKEDDKQEKPPTNGAS